jgi:hypothetical protein
MNFLPDLLEELSTLEGTLKSTQSSQIFAVESQEKFTPSDTQSKATPLSVSISTPQRLRDLQIVSERLALLRKQNFNA